MYIDIIAATCGFVASITIFLRNPRNTANILVGLLAISGGFFAPLFGTLREFFFPRNEYLGFLFGKFSLIALIAMTIPALCFSFFFWKGKNPKIPNLIYFFAVIPASILIFWLLLDSEAYSLVETPYGLNNHMSFRFSIVSLSCLLPIFLIFLIELTYMAVKARSFPSLYKRMVWVVVGFSVGVGGGMASIIIIQFWFKNIFQPAGIFIILSAISLAITMSRTFSIKKEKLWHGCPKLLKQTDGMCFCLNVEEGAPKEVKVLDLGNIIEHIQIDIDVLKTGEKNCANIVFVNDDQIVCCLTTHEPVKILGEIVTRKEMELAKALDIMEGNELCAECLHKIIAYRKEHKDQSDSEIRAYFLGVRAEEFFGVT
jgi:hypothetical protein